MPKRQLPLFESQPTIPDEITPKTPFLAAFNLFAAFLRSEGKSEHTIRAFEGDLWLLADYLDNPRQTLSDISTDKLKRFLSWMEHERGVPCSRKTYARRVTTLKVFFKWLHGIGALDEDPAQPLLQRSGPAPLSHVLNENQVEAAIVASEQMKKNGGQDYRPELLFRLLLETGIKKSEASRLTPEDIDRMNPNMLMLNIRHSARNVYKARRIQISSDLGETLDHYLEQYQLTEIIFDCTPRNLEYILTDVGERAGVPFKLSFEVMRWTCAVRDYRDGIELDSIREKLGLSRPSWYETSNKIRKLADLQIEAEKTGA